MRGPWTSRSEDGVSGLICVDELRDVGDEERDRVTEPAVDNESDDGNDRIGEDVGGGGCLENDIKKA